MGMYADITNLGEAVVHIQDMVENYGMNKQATAENVYFDKNGDLATFFGKILESLYLVCLKFYKLCAYWSFFLM